MFINGDGELASLGPWHECFKELSTVIEFLHLGEIGPRRARIHNTCDEMRIY